MKGYLSQRDLARLAGVSPMTISLALRNHPSISIETRQRIHKLAEEYHYRPDPALAVLNAHRNKKSSSAYQGRIGWLTNFPTKAGWRTMIQANGYYDGACVRAEELGYHIEEFWCNEPGMNARRTTQILLARNVRGLIVAPLPDPRGKLALEWDHFCAVSLGYSLMTPHLHVVMNHQFRNMKQVVEQLHIHGYRRIGFAMPSSSDERVDHNYLGGFWIAQQDLPSAAAQLAPLLAKNFDQKIFFAWFRRVRPDAIVVAASLIYRVIDWLKEENLRVPEDLGLAVASVPYRDTNISGIDENVPSIGAHAVDAVVGMIHRNERGIPLRPISHLLEGVWTPGQTLMPKHASCLKVLQ
jgi:DNA-binding LacI/PurR family transcriptional regulator